MEFLRWLRKSFERVAPPLAGVLPLCGRGVAGDCGGVCGALVDVCAGAGEGHGDDHGECSGVRERGWRGVHAAVSVSAAEWETGDGAGCKWRAEEIEFAAGETVPVLYREGDPQGAIIATTWRAYEGAIVFGVLGVALFDVGWGLRVMLRRRALRLRRQLSVRSAGGMRRCRGWGRDPCCRRGCLQTGNPGRRGSTLKICGRSRALHFFQGRSSGRRRR